MLKQFGWYETNADSSGWRANNVDPQKRMGVVALADRRGRGGRGCAVRAY
jgi:hypothetical protein